MLTTDEIQDIERQVLEKLPRLAGVQASLMLSRKIEAIATNDADYTRVDHLQVYKPGDVAIRGLSR